MSANQHRTLQIEGAEQTAVPWWQEYVTTVRICSFLFIWSAFAVWAFLIVNDSSHASRALLSAAGTISGPMVGAVSTNFQPCCVTCSLAILPYSAAILLAAVVVQFVRLNSEWERTMVSIRLVAWAIGWLGWFLGGTVSFFHAMS